MTVGKNIGHVRADKPPSAHAMGVLRGLAVTSHPAQEVNFTVRDKLLQFGYCTLELKPSPYVTHKPGREVYFLVITDAGREALEKARNASRT